MIKKNNKRKEEQSGEGRERKRERVRGKEGRREEKERNRESKREKRTVSMYCFRTLSWLVTALFSLTEIIVQ